MTAADRFDLFRRSELPQIADWLGLGIAVSLPWSTSATGILIALWLVAILPTLSFEMIRREATTPAGGLPVALWLFAALGMFWADVSWSERFGGLDGYDRLLVIPVLLAQFRRSSNGPYVLYGYLVSATCLLLTSWAFAIIPALWSYGKFYGVPVKDYILQSDEFLVCGFALLGCCRRVCDAAQMAHHFHAAGSRRAVSYQPVFCFHEPHQPCRRTVSYRRARLAAVRCERLDCGVCDCRRDRTGPVVQLAPSPRLRFAVSCRLARLFHRQCRDIIGTAFRILAQIDRDHRSRADLWSRDWFHRRGVSPVRHRRFRRQCRHFDQPA